LTALALAPDGQTLAAASAWGTCDLNLCSFDGGKVRTLLSGGRSPQGHPVSALEYSPDGKLLAIGSTDHTIKLWAVSGEGAQDVLGRGNYAFLLRAAPSGRSPSGSELAAPDSSLRANRAANGAARLQILRDGVLLREQEVPLARIVPGPLRLAARREGDRLILRINDLTPLEFQDALLLHTEASGFLGLHWPIGVRLERLWAAHQPLPPVPSALERGDHLFGRGKYTEALVQYQAQALASGASEVGQEARVKAAYCLLALSRSQEAGDGFERVTAEAGSRWPIVAGCELLMLRMRQGRQPDADTVFEILSRRHSFEQLAGFIPQEFRQQLSRAPVESFSRGRLVLLRPGPHLLRSLERARALQEFFRTPLPDRVPVLTGFVQTYHLLDQLDDGLRMAQELFDNPGYWLMGSPDARPVELTERYSYLLRQHGEPEKALARVDRQLLEKPALAPFVRHRVQISGVLASSATSPVQVLPWLYVRPEAVAYRPEALQLLIERARVLAALKRWDDAEKDLDSYLRLTTSNNDHAYDTPFYMACLVQGFLRERRGDRDGARAAWRRGLDRKREVHRAYLATSTVWYGVLLASLLGELTAEEAAIMFDRLTASYYTAGESVGALAAKAGLIPPANVLRTMCGTTRGRDAVRKLAFQEISYAESLRMPIMLIGAEMLHQGAMPGPLSAEQDDILWVVVEKIHSAWAAGKLNDAKVLQVALTWKGTTNFLGWAGVKGSLEPALRGPLAYIAGHRYLRLNRPADAVTFFRTARKDTPPGSAVHRLAQAELDRLNAK
jgi:tetratricopeptide (TPR) repeat protein